MAPPRCPDSQARGAPRCPDDVRQRHRSRTRDTRTSARARVSTGFKELIASHGQHQHGCRALSARLASAMRNSPGAALMQTYGKLRDYDRDRLCADGTTAERSVRSYARTPGSSLTIASTPRELGPADRYTSASAARCLASGARAVRHDCDHALAVDPGAARVAKIR